MADRVLRWAGPVVMALMMMRLTQIASRPLKNGDTWFHLSLGRDLGSPWDWGSVEHWSTFGTSPWVPTQPLSEQLMFGAYEVAGLPGVAWLYGFSLVVLLLAVYVVCRRRASPLVAALVTGAALVASAGSLSPRPQVISLILIVLVTDAWLRTEEDHQPRWWLVPATWVWSMCHGFWVIGVAIGVTVLIGMIIGGLRGKEAGRLAAVPIACGLVACFTPLGPELVLAPLTINERADLISEWQRTSFASPDPWLAVAMVAVATVGLARARSLSVARLMILAVAAFWLVLSVRTVAVTAMMTAPLLAIALQSLVPKVAGDRRRDIPALFAVGATLMAALAAVVPSTAGQPGFVPTSFDPRLDELPDGTTILNESGVGGWLAWRHPDLNVVVDGMFDAYPVDHLIAARDAMSARQGWQEFVAETNAEVAVLFIGAPLVDELASSGWRETGRDQDYVMLESPQLRR